MGITKPHFLFDLLLVILFTYGIFYSSYKFGRPDLGNHDFVKYEKMVEHPLNLSATRAPFVLRQLPTLVAFITQKAGIYYPNQISFTDSKYYHGEHSQRNLFALILSNYIAVVLGLTILIQYLRKKLPEKQDVHFIVLALCLGYFMLQLNIIAPLTQGYGWLATILLSIGLFEKKYLTFLSGAVIALFSRETVLLFFIVFSVGYAMYCYKRNLPFSFARNGTIILFSSLLLLFVLRISFTTGNSGQLSIIHLVGKTWQALFTKEYLSQAVLTQGLLVYLCILTYKYARPLANIYIIALLFIILVGGAGVGRIIGESYPLLVILYCLSKRPSAQSNLI